MFLPDWLAQIDHAETIATLNATLVLIKRLLALLGSLIIFVGALYAVYKFLGQIWKNPRNHQILNFDLIRLDLGRTIILGLEFIIAADVIETITAPDYYSLGIVAIIVLIRTFLNYSLNKDLATLSEQAQNQQNFK